MKQGKNNEIDLLLRSLVKGERSELSLGSGALATRENQGFADHLDADELSSLAEGVVPAPARARFIAHLADCDKCRGFVISLTPALGAAARSKALAPQTGAGFWRKIASLFSPPVLRYAVPAMALTAVIAVSFFALREQRRPDFVAQMEKTNSAAPALATPAPAESPLAQTNIEGSAKTRSTPELGFRLDSTIDRKGLQDEKSRVAQLPLTTTDADTSSSLSLKSSSESKPSNAAGVARPVFAPEPASAPAPPPKPALNDADKAGSVQKEEIANREVQGLPVENEKNQPRDETGRHGPSRNNNAIGGARRADGLVMDGVDSRAKSKKDSEDDGETRTVSGKRFRRQGNSWIDTAYESSRRTINVSRGSEQFRALVADEPAIRTIAEKLTGVVIVVSNGKAYRIQ